jgi:hypothetical protein
MIALLIILIKKESKTNIRVKLYSVLVTSLLVGYYILWIIYFAGMISPWMLVGMAILPSLYFIFVEMWMKNYIAIIPSVVFGIVHIASTWSNYL